MEDPDLARGLVGVVADFDGRADEVLFGLVEDVVDAEGGEFVHTACEFFAE